MVTYMGSKLKYAGNIVPKLQEIIDKKGIEIY